MNHPITTQQCYNAVSPKGTCIANAYCQFSQQACTNFMQTYLYSSISTHLFILTTNLHCTMHADKLPNYLENKSSKLLAFCVLSKPKSQKKFISISIIVIIVKAVFSLIDYVHDEEFIELQQFHLCNEDGSIGLEWKEVSNCIVSHFNHLNIHEPEFTLFNLHYWFGSSNTVKIKTIFQIVK